ncbi:Arginine/lysine/ornithine decarboxylase [Acetitomaculum ruminis DSM 5522]|uniref:Arginine/lysine/ornithine decarboxylase n=1 Tax=Acetitomaculum ruminis DSM 5522 TaxID=1120918 RepID=A0A1I0W8Y0_9FIRM|nr:aminotransferase class I/II-fold pyridoxal phosphate-dependent enzyme [Acetitomaculum ruminis]SFA84720.1 Arginine/lysine/ornithine decarboxylase [Acetitomaculum ruminis DSM 5522]
MKKKKNNLYQSLKEYGESDAYPFHMPGHKRNMDFGIDPVSIDITEIEDFDNLHAPCGIIKEELIKAKNLYGSDESFFMVNGSSGGLLSAISSQCRENDTILIARNCHKAVYNGIFLNKLNVEYVYPKVIEEFNIFGGISKDDIKEKMEKNPSIKVVVITSPTYEGIVSDVETIAKTVHEKEGILIVDEAHGAHFNFSDFFPKSALDLGADIVIQSLHKTLPAFTQSGILHIRKGNIDVERLREYLGIFQSSSPSYILMAGISNCLELLRKEGKKLFEIYENNLRFFYEKESELKKFHLLNKKDLDLKKYDIFDFDKSKLNIFSDNFLTGKEMGDILRRKYHIEIEASFKNYIIAMTSVMDKKEGFDRLLMALFEMEKNEYSSKESLFNKGFSYPENEKVYEIYKAKEMKSDWTFLENSTGKISGDYVYLYPPGLPVLTPGERISKKVIDEIRLCEKIGLKIIGIKEGKICVVADKEDKS